MKDEKFGYHYLWMIPLSWWYALVEKVKSLKSKIRGKYLRATNTTAKNALAILERGVTDGFYKCPDCYKTFHNKLIFIDHCEDEHGYPRDMDVERFASSGSVKEAPPVVKKASSDYLRYL